MKRGLVLLSFLIITFQLFSSQEARLVDDLKCEVLSQNSHSSLLFSVEKLQLVDMDQCMHFFDEFSDIPSLTSIDQDAFLVYATSPNRYIVFVSRKSEKVVGFLIADMILNRSTQGLFIRALGIDSDYRRLGLASKLLKHAEDFARKNNYQAMSLYASNDSARSCYEKLGFEVESKKYSDKKLIKKII